MANISHVDELIDYSNKIIQKIASSQEVIGLILNNPSVVMGSDEALSVYKNLYDYDFVEDTFTQDKAVIMVDADVIRADGGAIKVLEVYVQIVCSKGYMNLTPSVFKGIKGNRRDNIARQVDLLLNGSREFGIGRLELTSINTATVPRGLTSKLLTYRANDFSKDRSKLST